MDSDEVPRVDIPDDDGQGPGVGGRDPEKISFRQGIRNVIKAYKDPEFRQDRRDAVQARIAARGEIPTSVRENWRRYKADQGRVPNVPKQIPLGRAREAARQATLHGKPYFIYWDFAQGGFTVADRLLYAGEPPNERGNLVLRGTSDEDGNLKTWWFSEALVRPDSESAEKDFLRDLFSHAPQDFTRHADTIPRSGRRQNPGPETQAHRDDESEVGGSSRRAMPGSLIAAGVDGCPVGWVAALAIEGGPVEIEVFGSITALVDAVRSRGENPTIAIDVPIGLPSSPTHRPCDKQARALLKCSDKDRSREGSVFQVPDRELVALPSFEEVQRIVAERKAAHAAAKGISKQSFAIAPKIAEVDAFVRGTPGCEDWLVEVHPEVCFREMSGPAGPLLSKAKAEGREERRVLLPRALSEFGISLPDPIPKVPGAKRDDVLDAFVGLWTAVRHRSGMSITLGGERDQHGVLMRMVV
jgi:predicted RNase H-like nuclease